MSNAQPKLVTERTPVGNYIASLPGVATGLSCRATENEALTAGLAYLEKYFFFSTTEGRWVRG